MLVRRRGDRHNAAATTIACILPFIVSIVSPLFVSAQNEVPQAVERPRIGVALSGGAAKGLAHIGVLRVLQEAGVPIDVITGTSMGALVGGLRASGYEPAQLEQIVTDIDWDRLFSDAPERGQLFPDRRLDAGRTVVTVPFSSGRPQLPAGVVGGRNIHRLLARLTWPVQATHDFAALPIPFAALATDLETGAAVRLDRGVLADALRATMSIPGAFGPIRLDGRLLVDGGVVRNLPAQDARELGADIVICSDVSEPLARAESLVSAVDVLLQTVSFRMAASTQEQRRLCDILILPEIGGLSSFGFDRAGEWISRGDRAARALLPQLRALAGDGAAVTRPAQATPFLAPSLRVGRIDVRGVDGNARALALRALALEPGDLTAGDVDRAIGRVYSTELFGNAAGSIAIGPDTVLTFDVESASGDQVGFGFRYDDRYKASLLFTASLHNVLEYGSLSRLELRLGEQVLLEGRYTRGRGLASPITLSGTAALARVPLDIYDAGMRVAAIRVSLLSASVLLGSTVGRSGIAGIHGGIEWERDATTISVADTANGRTISTFGLLYRMDTLDRNEFPTRGVSALSRLAWAVPAIGNGDFTSHFADVTAALPISATVSIRLRAYAGLALGDVPYYRRFFLGGATAPGVFAETQPTFDGLSPQERSGRAIQMVAAAFQWEPRTRVFLTARMNAGATADRWTLDLGNYTSGWAFSLGTLTVAGPIEVSIAGRSFGHSNVHLGIGHVF